MFIINTESVFLQEYFILVWKRFCKAYFIWSMSITSIKCALPGVGLFCQKQKDLKYELAESTIHHNICLSLVIKSLEPMGKRKKGANNALTSY